MSGPFVAQLPARFVDRLTTTQKRVRKGTRRKASITFYLVNPCGAGLALICPYPPIVWEQRLELYLLTMIVLPRMQYDIYVYYCTGFCEKVNEKACTVVCTGF